MSATYNFTISRSLALLLAGCFVAVAVLMFAAGAISGVLYSSSRVEAALAAAKTTESATLSPANKPVKQTAMPASETSSSQPAPTPVATTDATATTSNNLPPQTAAAPAAADASPKPQEPAVQPAAATASAAEPKSAPASQPAPTVASAQANPKPTTAPAAAAPSASAAAPPPASAAAAPSASAAASPVTTEATYAIPLAVQVGSFLVKSNAEKLMASLRDLGYNPVMSRSADARGRIWYKVSLGPYRGWNAASTVAMRVSIAENLHPIIGPMR
jgi:cell division protein FtsN